MKQFKTCKDCPHFEVTKKKKDGIYGMCRKYGDMNFRADRTACNTIYGKKSSAERLLGLEV